ncbi:MAG TPA: conjugal transfer protein TraS [Hydrogenophaga sp.]|uniref:relaxase/mobilization nuclease domain-containing protein n=1 Tax=Hydrogenophaga sp. TaxID=1904254 RepID=UPI0008B05DCA|nr:conjugal transfer protein TraS [Hydrogenophaga sp.]OGA76102.1 MAG: conjugal transfer protein TraS [Burkholderiales bacterium GWE1_65_30]OGA91068.1 MAG: conjugal transfer protein TraS [Burkholderiales bacterium GWF1_66_17]HAX23305.1 conjugal transfer protein TraS [Hydrogenophaga sp.]HBU19209.1 conjugal transfer protein TraS [Hydrogenophaga sp.]
MSQAPNIDGVLVQWGDRLFYPGNRVVKVRPQPKLGDGSMHQRADAIRKRIESTVVKRAPQVMVKVTGGGRGMLAIAAHFRYISKNGRLGMENEQGEVLQGRSAVYELSDEWRCGGSLIGDEGHRREAFNIMLSMPRGTDPRIVQRAASEFAKTELANHKYVMVLHDHQANPHVHLSVRAESIYGKRLNPRKADLQRWRETFAEKLRGYGLEAEATRQATRFQTRNSEHLWRLKAREDGRLRKARPEDKSSPKSRTTRTEALRAWLHIGQTLAKSPDARDVKLAGSIALFLQGSSLPVGLSRIPPDRTQPTRTGAVVDHEVRR